VLFPYIPANTDISQVLKKHTNDSSTSNDYDNNQVSGKSKKQPQQESPVMSPDLDSESFKKSKLSRVKKASENASTGMYVHMKIQILKCFINSMSGNQQK